MTALGADELLVAVGGTYSYNDAIRDRVIAKELLQIGYGWHSPPELDVLVASRPDVMIMVMGDLGHLDQYERIQQLGIPVVPTFLDAESDYMGRVATEWGFPYETLYRNNAHRRIGRRV